MGQDPSKGWSDELFKQRLINNPKAILEDFGIKIEEGATYKVHENTKKTHHLVIPEIPSQKLSEEEIKKTSGGACPPPPAPPCR